MMRELSTLELSSAFVSHATVEPASTQENIPATGFSCARCGQCCRQLNLNDSYRELDRGDGVCRHFIDATNLCAIYDDRPDLCRIDLMYEHLFMPHMTRTEYHAATQAACLVLQSEATPAAAFERSPMESLND